MISAITGVIILCEFHLVSANDLQWLSIGLAKDRPNFITRKWCKRTTGFAPRQRKICKDHTLSMPAIISASRLALKACQIQMADRDWNCTTDSNGRFNPSLRSGSRESALMHALGSSAIAFTIAKYCKRGLISNCGCVEDPSTQENDKLSFEWSGCSDNILTGATFAEAFMKSWDLRSWRYKRHDNGFKGSRWRKLTKVLSNLRNSAAGTNVLRRSIKKMCVCHGMSGTCEITTCWRSLPAYAIVAKTLKSKYDKAVQVRVMRHHEQEEDALKPTFVAIRDLRKSDLIFFRNPQKLCKTKGRECVPYSFGLGSCEDLCCGRGFESRTRTKFEKCRCRFVSCCEVTCDSCESTEVVHTCR